METGVCHSGDSVVTHQVQTLDFREDRRVAQAHMVAWSLRHTPLFPGPCRMAVPIKEQAVEEVCRKGSSVPGWDSSPARAQVTHAHLCLVFIRNLFTDRGAGFLKAPSTFLSEHSTDLRPLYLPLPLASCVTWGKLGKGGGR